MFAQSASRRINSRKSESRIRLARRHWITKQAPQFCLIPDCIAANSTAATNMSEANKNRRRLSDIVASADRCIYCANAATTVEHMPPISMFHTRQRPKGMEFASCEACNNGTRAADTVAAFFARISQHEDSLMIAEAMKLRRSVSRLAPGVAQEFFRPENTSAEWFQTRGGILKPMIVVRSDGPLTKRYLQIFAAKFGMALYREHVGEPLPLHGAVHVIFFLNAGLAEDTVLGMLVKLPLRNALQQGSFQVPRQFAYRYNTDKKSIVAGLAGFHSNLHLFVMATSEPDFYEVPPNNRTCMIRPGELSAIMPDEVLRPTG